MSGAGEPSVEATPPLPSSGVDSSPAATSSRLAVLRCARRRVIDSRSLSFSTVSLDRDASASRFRFCARKAGSSAPMAMASAVCFCRIWRSTWPFVAPMRSAICP